MYLGQMACLGRPARVGDVRVTAGIDRDRADSVGPVDLISDPPLLERWLRELVSAPQSASATADWPTYTDAAKARLGPAMLNVVLGTPRLTEDIGDAGDRDLTDGERRRVRRDLETAVRETMPLLPAVDRLAIAALVLYAAPAKGWGSP